MTEYDNKGQVSIWGNKDATNPKAPKWRGSFYAHRDIKAGEEIDIALWRNESDNPRAPVMKGKCGDKHRPQEPSEPKFGDDRDEEPPF